MATLQLLLLMTLVISGLRVIGMLVVLFMFWLERKRFIGDTQTRIYHDTLRTVSLLADDRRVIDLLQAGSDLFRRVPPIEKR
ncbi:MAG TPA: hypothetical protein VIQ76_16680 [Propionibacteriaceae bacterium]|jgi:hypothetical protein